MKTNESLPCVCGKGALDVEVSSFGNWRVEKLVTPCNACGSNDIKEAREAVPVKAPSS